MDQRVQSAAVLYSNGDGLDIAVVNRSRVGVRGVAEVQRRAALRLLRSELRQAAWRQWHPMAL
ncbi:hypothetical protein MGAST_00720 [Mycobacterium gastri 'Wayne']|uniref:Uncharacterized protein n=1 Tax=Mycobacterium gastri TaxID=1777 RepID=A0A1X1W141_MYCGS|nr:hypothetical protein MGAST_00720 [Mycobacterium gastri 'Wayne']ORV79485.1 hypothetical protein AWC07_22290 [Mycobacterium gastri]